MEFKVKETAIIEEKNQQQLNAKIKLTTII